MERLREATRGENSILSCHVLTGCESRVGVMEVGERSCWRRCSGPRTCEVLAALPGPAAPAASLPPSPRRLSRCLGILLSVSASFPLSCHPSCCPGILLAVRASFCLSLHPSHCPAILPAVPGHLPEAACPSVTAPGCPELRSARHGAAPPRTGGGQGLSWLPFGAGSAPLPPPLLLPPERRSLRRCRWPGFGEP